MLRGGCDLRIKKGEGGGSGGIHWCPRSLPWISEKTIIYYGESESNAAGEVAGGRGAAAHLAVIVRSKSQLGYIKGRLCHCHRTLSGNRDM